MEPLPNDNGAGDNASALAWYRSTFGDHPAEATATEGTPETPASPPDENSQALDWYYKEFGGNPSDQRSGPATPQTSFGGAALRAAGESVAPGAAAAAAFGPSAAAGTAVGGPILGLVTGIGGSALAAGAAAWGQHKVAEAVLPQFTKSFDELTAADTEQHPVAGAIGRLAASLPMFEIAPVQTIKGAGAIWKMATGKAVSDVEREAAKATAAQVGLGTGQGIVSPLMMGESPTVKGVAESFAQSLILGQPKYAIFGKHNAEAIQKEANAAKKTTNPVDNPEEKYEGAPPPEVPHDKIGELTDFAQRIAAGAPLHEDDPALHKLMADNPAVHAFVIEHRQKFAKDIIAATAVKAAKDQQEQADMAAAIAEKPTEEVPSLPGGPTHEWIGHTIDALSAPLEANGVADKIEQLSAQRKTSAEVASELGIDIDQVRAVRAKRGIPSMDTEGFEQWAASKQPPSEIAKPPPAQEPTPLNVESVVPAPDGVGDVKPEPPVPANPAPAVQIEAARQDVNPNPTEAQKEAGNYAKGHVTIDGMDVAIENPKGSLRKGVDSNGKPWQVEMPGDYGYINGTKGHDGDHVDVTIGSNPDGYQKVWVIDQKKPDGSFDEHKSMLGYGSRDEAMAAYRASFSDGKADQRIMGVTEMPKEVFKDWVEKGNTKKPLSSQPKLPPEWTKHQGDPEKLLDQVRDTAETDRRKVGETETKGTGSGQQRAEMFTDLAGVNPKTAEEAIKLDAKNGKPGTKVAAMLSPDGSHVVVSRVSVNGKSGETRETWTAKLATFVKGVGGKVPGQDRYAGDFNKMVKAGWTPLATLKLSEPMEKPFSTYSPAEWEHMASELHKIKIAEQGYAESMGPVVDPNLRDKAAQAVTESMHGNASDESHVESEVDSETVENELAEPVNRTFRTEHAAALAEAVNGVDPEDIKTTADLATLVRESKTPRRTQEAITAMVSDLVKRGLTPQEAITTAHEILYEAASGNRQSAATIEEAFGGKAGKPSSEIAGHPNAPGAGTPAGNQPGAGGSETGANPNPTGGAGATAKPNPANAAAENANAARVKQERLYRAQTAATIERLRPSYARMADVAQTAIRSLQALGIQVHVILDPLAKHFASGEYKELLNGRGNAERVINWHVSDAANPTVDNLVALFHEAGHAVFSKESPEMQAALHRAVESFTNEQLGIGGFKEAIAAGVAPTDAPFVQQEGRLVQSLAMKLVGEGFDPGVAQSTAAKVWKVIKDVARGVYMAIQKMAGYPVSNERAMAYFESRLQDALRGEKSMSLLDFLGGPRQKQPDLDRVPAPGDNVLPGTVRYSVINPVNNPLNLLERPESAPTGVATMNHLADTVKRAVHEWDVRGNLAGHTPAGIIDRFIHLPGEVGDSPLFSPGKTPASMIADAVKQHGVSPETKINDLPNDIAKKRAAAVEHLTLSAMDAEMEGKAKAARGLVKESARELEVNNNALTRMAKGYVDVDKMTADMRKSMLDQLQFEKETVRGIRDYASRTGALEDTLRKLDETLTDRNEIPPPYRKAIDAIHAALMNPQGDNEGHIPLTETMQHIGGLDIDWNMPARALRESLREHYAASVSAGTPDLYIKSLLQNDPRSVAMLSTVISAAKANTHLMDLTALARDKAFEEKTNANQMLQQLVGASKDTIESIKRKITLTFANLKMRDRMVRIADKIADLKKTNGDLLKEIQRGEAVMNFHEEAWKPVSDAAKNEMAKIAGISMSNFEVYHGAKVPVPMAVDSGPDKFTDKVLSLKDEVGKRGMRTTPDDEVASWLRRMKEWLDNPVNEQHAAKFNEVADAAWKLEHRYVEAGHTNMRQNILEKFLAPIQDRAFALGTPLGRSIGQSFNVLTASIRAHTTEVGRRGTTFATALNEARKACGFSGADEATFWHKVISPALHDAEQNGRRSWGTLGSRKEMVDAEVKHTLDFMKLTNPTQRAAVERLIREQISNAEWTVANGANDRQRVLDQSKLPGGKDYRIYRPVLGQAPMTLPRSVTEVAHEFYRENMTAWGGDSMKKEVNAKAYDTDPNSLSETLKSRFTKPVMDWFVKSLAHNDSPSFYAPPKDGLRPLASRNDIISAYEHADGDVVKFAENLSLLNGQRPTGEFVAETLDTIQNFHNLLRSAAGDIAEVTRNGVPSVPRPIVDARHYEAMPNEWLEYPMLDAYNMGKIVHTQGFQSAFGRNGAAMDANLAASTAETRTLNSKYTAWRDEAKIAEPGLSEKQLQGKLKARAEAEGVDYTRLANSQRHLNLLNDIAETFNAVKQMNNSGAFPELRPFSRLMKFIQAGTVSGMGTAITAHSVFLEQPLRHFGFTSRALAMTGHSIVDFSKVTANMMLQAFGMECRFCSDRMVDAHQAGLFDPISKNTEKLISAVHQSRASLDQSGRFGRGVGMAADVGTAAMQSDVWLAPGARAKALARQEAGEATAPTFKILSPFHMAAEALKISNFITWQRHIEGMVSAGAKYLSEHPEAVDDDAFKFKREMLTGFAAGDREFNFLRTQLGNFGESFESMVRDAHANAGSDKPILSHETNRAIQQMTLNEITLESSLTSRMPALQTKGLGVTMNPFLGWPLQKAYQVMHSMRQPNGEMVWKSWQNGIAPYMAILPIGMAVAWLRNKFDEDVLGRKQNVSDLSTIHDLTSAWQTCLDNASRVGTFGMLGEFGNYFLNSDNPRPLTVDSRVFFLNTLEGTGNIVRSLYHQTGPQIMAGNTKGALATATDYQTVLRPLFQQLGGNGMLQNLGALNHLLSMDNAEARVSNRISVNNYLRVAGRQLDMDVRTYDGMMQSSSLPNPIKPFIGQMVLAAYANDHEGFQKAKEMAIAQALADKLKPDEARRKVITMFEAHNPMSVVFKSKPTVEQFQRLVAALPDSGKASVAQAMQLYGHYASQIGAAPNVFAKDKPSSLSLLPSTRGSGLTLDAMRDGAVAFGR